MTEEEYELMLFDRIEVIKATNKKYDLENNAYISFSGGKDSTVLHYLVDMALPDNKIPRVYVNTGIEYNDIVDFVMRERDSRIEIVKPTQNIKQMLEKVGYPFKSKEHSNKVSLWQHGSRAVYVHKYVYGYGNIENSRYACPNILKYQFTDKNKLKISDKCCYELKKKPVKKWEHQNNKRICITGMQRTEGGQRTHIDCIVVKDNKVVKFHPLAPITDEWEQWFIEKYDIQLCKLYYPPYNFKRTGCKGCPYALTLQEQLDTMAMYLPNEKKQCEIIWKPVYDEYRRIGYRLRKDGEQTIYDFL